MKQLSLNVALATIAGALFAGSALAQPPIVIRHSRHLTLDAQATLATLPVRPLYCKFWQWGQPKSFVYYNPRKNMVLTKIGTSPSMCRMYKNITTTVGDVTYGDAGFTLKAFGDVPVLSVRTKCTNIPDLFAFLFDKQKATWGTVPDGPKGVIDAGECKEGEPPGIFEDWDFDFHNCDTWATARPHLPPARR